jgi:serine/threonine protein phosphatase PrpC
MHETKNYLQKLFAASNINIAAKRATMFEAFAAEQENINAVNQILQNQKNMMEKWKLRTRIIDVKEQNVSIPNATVGKAYTAKLNFEKLQWTDFIFSDFEALDKYGLTYNNEEEIITGTPTQSGDFKVKFLFKVDGEAEDTLPNEKWFTLIINADPKSLWKNIPSTKEDAYWKEDNIAFFEPLGSKHIVAASKRGRSHANVGSFRDDDVACKYFERNGWSVVAVADGAGSAKASRKGSDIACKTIIDFFENAFITEVVSEFDNLVTTFNSEDKSTPEAATQQTMVENETTASVEMPLETVITPESNGTKISKFIYHYLGNAAKQAHSNLSEFANKKEIALKDLHSTLIFALYKKYSFGYVVLSFGVGDCPIGLIGKQPTDLKLMNWLDVGEFGGGTRFITMPEIFTSEKFATRFGFKIIEDFSYLMLMTDGIYDPKFVVEASLEKPEKWQEFIADLKGNNDDKASVDLRADNADIADELSTWMDFWSPGNHDDRTLAIVF